MKKSTKQVSDPKVADEAWFLKDFRDSLIRKGFLVPFDAKFYKVTSGENKGLIGMKVGYFIHSCHVECSDIYVLLHTDNNDTFVKDYWELMDLEEIKQ